MSKDLWTESLTTVKPKGGEGREKRYDNEVLRELAEEVLTRDKHGDAETVLRIRAIRRPGSEVIALALEKWRPGSPLPFSAIHLAPTIPVARALLQALVALEAVPPDTPFLPDSSASTNTTRGKKGR